MSSASRIAATARAVVQALAAILIPEQLDRLLAEHDRCANFNSFLRIRQPGVDRHLVDGHRLVLLARLQQMRRQAGYHAVQRLVRKDGDLGREQHTRIDPANRRKADKAAVQHLCDNKADLIKMGVQQNGFRVLFAARFIGEHVAVAVHLDRIAIRPQQVRHCVRRLGFKPADRRQRAQRPQGFCKLQG